MIIIILSTFVGVIFQAVKDSRKIKESIKFHKGLQKQ